MNMQNLVKLNKRQDKVVLTFKATSMHVIAKLLQFGIPAWYIIYAYGLFSYKNAGYSATGGTFLIGIIGYAVFQQSIKDWLNAYRDELSTTIKRAKWVGVWLSLALFVWIGSVFLQALILLFMSGAIGTASSLWFWKQYDLAIEEKKELNELLKNETKARKLQELKALKKAQE